MITEQASSLTERRKGMKKLLALVGEQAVDVVLIEYPDRLVRFGFGYLEQAFSLEGCALGSARPAQAPGTHRRTHSGHVDHCDRVCRQAVWPSSQRCAQAGGNGAQGMRAGRAGQWDRPVVPPSCSLTSRIVRDGGANTSKRAYLEETGKILDAARAFYLAFFLAHRDKLAERVRYFSEKQPAGTGTAAFSQRAAQLGRGPHRRNGSPSLIRCPPTTSASSFPEFPFIYRRSVIKDALGKARSYLSNLANWNTSGKKKGQPGNPGASNHPTLYEEAFCLDLDATDLRPGPAHVLCLASRSTQELVGNGTTIRSNGVATLKRAGVIQPGSTKVPN